MKNQIYYSFCLLLIFSVSVRCNGTYKHFFVCEHEYNYWWLCCFLLSFVAFRLLGVGTVNIFFTNNSYGNLSLRFLNLSLGFFLSFYVYKGNIFVFIWKKVQPVYKIIAPIQSRKSYFLFFFLISYLIPLRQSLLFRQNKECPINLHILMKKKKLKNERLHFDEIPKLINFESRKKWTKTDKFNKSYGDFVFLTFYNFISRSTQSKCLYRSVFL